MSMPSPMRDDCHVVHALAWYFPESTGGTEVYVKGLVAGLAARNIRSTVLAPATTDSPTDHRHNGIDVIRFQGSDPATQHNAPTFAECLRSLSPDLYHQHSWTPDCGSEHLEIARSLGLPHILTAHIPNIHCLRGTMMRDGRTACDGEVRLNRCTSCLLQQRGLPRGVSTAVAACLPSRFSPPGRLPSKLSTLLSMKHQVHERQRQLQALANSPLEVVTVCDWLNQAFRRNGFDASRLTLSRQGVDPAQRTDRPADRSEQHRMVFGYLGRAHPTKGVQIILDAFAALNPEGDESTELRLFAVAVTDEDQSYLEQLKQRHRDHPAIHWEAPVDHAQIGKVLQRFDALLVPSQWLETGPLVVYEALAAGTRVIGSDLGGIAELAALHDQVTLVPPRSVKGWTHAMGEAVRQQSPGIADQQPAGQAATRSMDDAAEDASRLYRKLLTETAA